MPVLPRATTALVGLAALTALSGCSLQSNKVAEPPAAPQAVRSGGDLRVGVTAPGGIDPIDAYEPAGKLISSAMCDTLVSLDPVTGQVREAIATGWVVTNDGGITLKTRKGVRFNDGSAFTAKDVNYSLQQLLAAANGSKVAGVAQQFASYGTKASDVLADPNNAPDVANLVSSTDLQVSTTRPDGGALRSFAEPAMAPISRTAYERDSTAFAARPVCVGPYRLAKPYRPGDTRITLVRANSYYKHNVGYTGGGAGYPDMIVFRVYPTSAAALAGYARHEVDVVQVPNTLTSTVQDGASLVYGPATGVEFLGMPSGTPGPMTDLDLRQALSLALDRGRLARDVFGPSAQPATGFEPPALAITTGTTLDSKTGKGAPLSRCSSSPVGADVVSARRHLAAASKRLGADNLRALTLTVNNDAPYPQLARAVTAQWRATLGLSVKVITRPWNDYLSAANGSPGLAGMFRIRWASDLTAPTVTFNDQQSYLSTLLSSDATSNGNWEHWDDRTFDYGLTVDAAQLTDVQQRGIAFGKLADLACKQLPLLPLVFQRPTFLVRSTTVGSARPVPVGRDGVLLLRELYLK